nr:replication initiation factor domain-containing protein [Acinetobacter cumulans]
MGVTVSNPCTAPSDFDLPFPTEFPTLYTHLVKTASGVKEVPTRLPAENEIAIVDWVNFTFGIETLGSAFFEPMTPDNLESVCLSAITTLDEHLEQIFGFSTTARNKTGRNFYKQSYVLGHDMGLVCIGGQRNTILVMLSGKGCSFATEGWERRLYTFLTNIAKRAKLTRIDLAHDDFSGENINVDWAEQHDTNSEKGTGFQNGSRKPNVEHKGNWKRPNGRGRTLNIGSRESGMYVRVYEKGRAEGDPDDNWQRAEVEFKACDRILPFDMLLAPSEYFMGSYPCFSYLKNDIQPSKIESLKKNASISAKAALETIKHQYGKYINLFKQVFDPEELINLISHPDKYAYPKRLDHVLLTAMRM